MFTYGKVSIFYTLICFYLILGVECDSGGSRYLLSIQTGGSVTIPCHYDRKYTQQRKYWYSSNNPSSIYTNTTEENLSVIDYPDQSLFTLTMRNLQEKHNAYYCCAVETDEQPIMLVTNLYLYVLPVPDLSVVNSRVTGQEGGNISVQCLYSSGYNKEKKQWCRYKDQCCYTERRTDTSQNSSVQISDDGRESFTVVMTGLTMSDSGWYWCAVQDLLIPVQLTITERKPATVTIGTEKDTSETGNSETRNGVTTSEEQKKTNAFLFVWLSISAALLILFTSILVCVLTRRWRRRHKENVNQIRERNSTRTTDTVSSTLKDADIYSTVNDDNPNISSSLEPSTDVTYSTIAYAPTKQCKAHCPADGVIYSTVAQR
ncbi:CMRF35-like molecule 1 isoform X2 [Myxocyprinus asiaticus]|uniref:CMRF35-like molecule 1 isoform X2 n=1 Tax=Myxocyprinus asiaticus TaxID=70543 RepID=UPI0022223F12|nr:CMRF35-like molecule 1 isoform X2 [Myxocyprinus asiaticus]